MIPEKFPPTNELSKQEKDKVIEAFRQERLRLLTEYVKNLAANEKFKRLLSGVVNATVGSYIKLSIEAYRGETIEGKDLKGQKLTPYGRAMDIIIVASGLGSYIAIALGKPDFAVATYAASWTTWLLMYGADTIGPALDKAAEKAKANNLDFYPFLQGISDLLHKSKDVYIKRDDNPNQN